MSCLKSPDPLPLNSGLKAVRSYTTTYHTTTTYKIRWGRVFILLFILGLITSIPFLLYFWLDSDIFWRISKLFGLSLFVLFTPTISSIFTKNLIVRTLLDSIIFCGIIFFSCWYLNIQLSLKWYLIACGIVFVIEWGGFFNRFNAYYFLYNLREKEEGFYKKLVKSISKSMLISSCLYLSIPISLLIGGSIGIYQSKDIIYIIKLALFTVLSITGAFLFVLLFFNFVKMSSGLVGISPRKNKSFDKIIETALTVSKARQVFLYDSLHDIILFIGVIYVGLNIYGIPVSPVAWC